MCHKYLKSNMDYIELKHFDNKIHTVKLKILF